MSSSLHEESAEPLLSSDETEALLAAMRNGAANTQSTKELELGSTDQRLRQSLERADVVTKEYALEIRKMLRRVTGLPHPVLEGTADVVPFNVFASSLVPGSAIVVLRVAGALVGFLLVGPRLSVRILSRRLGGGVPAPDAPEEPPRSLLSPVDRRVIRPFMQECVDLFSTSFRADGWALEMAEVLPKPSEMPKMPQFEPLLRMPISIGFGADQTEEMAVVLTAAGMPAAPQEKPQLPSAENIVSNIERARLAARLSHAEVELVAVLGHARSTVREILKLNVGDIIRLHEPPDTPVRLSVEGRDKLIGLPVVQHGNLAVEIIDVLRGTP